MTLEGDCSFYKSQVDRHSQRLSVYRELKSMGLGLRELKIILNTIKEIAAENNIIDYRMAVDKFIEFLEEKYDIKLRLKIQEQQKHQKMQPSRSFVYRKSTTFHKTSEEQSDHFNNNNSDEQSGSDDDQSSSHSNV